MKRADDLSAATMGCRAGDHAEVEHTPCRTLKAKNLAAFYSEDNFIPM